MIPAIRQMHAEVDVSCIQSIGKLKDEECWWCLRYIWCTMYHLSRSQCHLELTTWQNRGSLTQRSYQLLACGMSCCLEWGWTSGQCVFSDFDWPGSLKPWNWRASWGGGRILPSWGQRRGIDELCDHCHHHLSTPSYTSCSHGDRYRKEDCR